MIGAVLAAGLVFLAVGGEDEKADAPTGEYLVRAVFDSGSFIVSDEDVRIAGANVGHVEAVDVSLPGEKVSNEPGDEEQAGKAVVVMSITDPGFQDFRQDARCIMRPQSLLGERYVACQPTMPRSDAEEAPPPLEQIPPGEPGAGQHLLPLENNGTNVDIDLLQNIQRQPYADRFRIILNELGAGLAARGDDIAEIVERADPTLREVNRVLAILNGQRRRLTRLAVDSEKIMRPLSRVRGSVTGFIEGAGESAQATAERRAELEAALAKFPAFLTELRSTMAEFDDFSASALPVTKQLGIAAPSLTEATELLEPFSDASTTALVSFGHAAEEAGPKLEEADPIVKTARDLAISGQGPTKELKEFLGSTRRTKGFERLMELIYNTGGSVNGFDAYGHFLRTMLVATNCVDYVPGWLSGCQARYQSSVSDGPPASAFPGLIPESFRGRRADAAQQRLGDAVARVSESGAGLDSEAGDTAGEPAAPESSTETQPPEEAPSAEPGAAEPPQASSPRTMNELLDFLMRP